MDTLFHINEDQYIAFREFFFDKRGMSRNEVYINVDGRGFEITCLGTEDGLTLAQLMRDAGCREILK